MLEKDPDQRMGIYDLIRHEWVTDNDQNPIDLDLIYSSESEHESQLQ